MSALESKFHINNINDFNDKNLRYVKKDLRNIKHSPNLFPYKINLKKNKIYFVKMNKKKYKESFFVLSPGEGPGYLKGKYCFSINLSELNKIFSGNEPINNAAIIYNHGFCCSTLFCRVFEEYFNILSLKEPPLLHQISNSIKEDIENDNLSNIILYLHSRTYSNKQSVLIKPSDYAFDMISITENLNIPTLFLYSPLDEYIASCSEGKRPSWIKNRFNAANINQRLLNFLKVSDKDLDLKKTSIQSSLYWCYFIKKIKKYQLCNKNIITVNCNTFLDDPSIISNLGQYLKLNKKINLMKNKNISRLLNKYAKTDDYFYNKEIRRSNLSAIIKKNIEDIKEAESIAENILKVNIETFKFSNEYGKL